MSLTDDKVEDVMRRIQKVEDAYVTMQGKVLRTREKLQICGVSDGCTIQVTSRMRGGGRHKDKKSKVEKKQVTRQEPVSSEGPVIFESEKDKVIQAIEEDERYRNFLAYVSEGNDTKVEQKMQYWKTELQAKPGADKEQMKVLECGIRWAVEARRKGRGDEQEQRWKGEQEQNSGLEQSMQGKQVRFSAKKNG